MPAGRVRKSGRLLHIHLDILFPFSWDLGYKPSPVIKLISILMLMLDGAMRLPPTYQSDDAIKVHCSDIHLWDIFLEFTDRNQ